jgi:hypothetical protein
VSAADTLVVLFFVSVATLFVDARFAELLWPPLVIGWALVGLAGVWLSSARLRAAFPRLHAAKLLGPLHAVTWREAVAQLGIRGAYHALAIGCIAALLDGMGARLPWLASATFGPLLLFTQSLPVTWLGLGGPQGLSTELLARQWQVLTREDALAFSLMWSAMLLGVQALVGLTHLPLLVACLRGGGAARE